MKRFRLSTLMLLIVIAALCIALVVHQNRAARREAELMARLPKYTSFKTSILKKSSNVDINKYMTKK